MSTPTPTPNAMTHPSPNEGTGKSDTPRIDAVKFTANILGIHPQDEFVLVEHAYGIERELNTANLKLADALRERDEARAGIELGQINCDAVFNDLKRERDVARVKASLDREKAVKLRTQLAEEQALADRLAQALEAVGGGERVRNEGLRQAALRDHALRRKPS
ncbi:MAG: hypothetical protein JSR30_00180 [Proteobacteria bacterium]|nr:hypothetical protein [Pseudomonadota bacterium]